MSHEGTAPTAQEPVDRKAMLLEQFNEVEAAPPVTDGPKPTEQVAAPTDSRPRDEAGKFVHKETAPTPAPPVQAAPVAAPVEEPAWSKAPDSWKKEKHTLWAGMTPEAREYAFQREQQMKAGVEPLLPKAELADRITKAAEPYMDTVRGLGLELPQAVAGLMKADHDLRTLPYEQKLQRLSQIAMSYGIDLSGQIQGAQQAFPPQVQTIQNELLQMKGQFQTFAQQQQAAADRAAQDEIQRFAKTAEHFEEVKPAMAQLLQSGMAEGIQDAYEKAIRLNPELFDQIQTAKQAAADVEKRRLADVAAKAAKAAAVSVKSATPGAVTATKAQDRRSRLIEQFDRLSERL